MDEKEIKDLLNKAAEQNGAAIAEAVKKAVDEATKGLLKADELAAKLVDAGLSGEEIKKFMDAVEKQGEAIRKMEVAGATRANARKSFGQVVIDALVKNKTLETKINKGEHRVIEIEDFDVTKVAGTMTTANVDAVGDNSIAYELADFERGLTRIQRRSPYLLSIANTSPTTKMYVQWAEQANPDGAAAATAEGNDKAKIDFDWVEKSKKVEKLTAYIKVSVEALDDLDGLKNEIDTELREVLMLKVDADLLSGDGNAPNLLGLLGADTAYAAGNFAATVEDANMFDALRTAVAQVVAAEFMPNYIIMHPNDVAKLDLQKGGDGHYVLPPFKSANGQVISGVQIIENTGYTEGSFTVGDFSKFNIRVRKGFSIDVGRDGNDFIKNLVTILAEIRLVSYIKANHQAAFVTGTFAAAIAALEAA